MAILKSRAIPVRITEYSETSVVAVFFAREHGLAHVICKGARRKGKAYESTIDLLVLGEITFYERTSGLHVLKEFAPQESFPGLRADMERYRAAMASLEFVRAAAMQGEPAPGLFDLFCEALRACAKGRMCWTGTYAFFTGALMASGFSPMLDSCASCASRKFPPGKKARTAVSFEEGGVLCMNCGRGRKVGMWLGRNTLNALRRLQETRPCEAAGTALEPRVALEVKAFLRRWCEFTFEHGFRMLK